MSLGGIAIAIGAMVDAAIVMVENAHKKLEAWKHAHAGDGRTEAARACRRGTLAPDRRGRRSKSARRSSSACSIITLSFVPVFALEAQAGRMFKPLAYTKTYAMAASALLAVTLVPVLMGYVIRGRIPGENANPLNRWLHRRLPPAAALGAALAEGDARDRRARARGDRVSGDEARRRVHAAARRRRPAVHADGAARAVGRQGVRAPAADRPDDPPDSRGEERVRQDRPRRDGDRSGAARDDRDDDPVQAEERMARRA